jgi:hypothetical protein
MATWSSTNKMAVNVNKTKLIAFHTKDKPFPENRIKNFFIDNKCNHNDPNLISELERYHNKHPDINCREHKLLGIYFDENLTFGHHTNALCNKLNKSVYCINKAKNFLTKSLIKL